MKLYDGSGKYIKLIPKKYEKCENIFAHLTDFDHRRLSRDERTNIEIALFIQSLDAHTKTLLIDKSPVQANYIITRDRHVDNYYTIVFANRDGTGRREVRCHRPLYKLIGNKQTVKRMF